MEVVIGPHPIPQKYYKTHPALGTWESRDWQEKIQPTMTDEKMRSSYD